MVVNHARNGNWIEIKPNRLVNKVTYLESTFTHGEKTGKWAFYDYIDEQKGKLLYTETYERNELIDRIFIDPSIKKSLEK